MPYAHHLDPNQKWRQQYLTTKNHIIPFICSNFDLKKNAKVLEIGCGEGGVLKAFTELGCICYGIDIAPGRIENAKKIMRDEAQRGLVEFYPFDVYDTEHFIDLFGKIDLIILKDAIEHIPDQKKFMTLLHQFIRPDGRVFLAFPPWFNPFGGHQQIADSLLRFVPWFHLLPRGLYRQILTMFGEDEKKIEHLAEIYDTGLSVNRFEQITKSTCWMIYTRQFFLINPGYEYKFDIQAKRQLSFISKIPFFRDFVSTAVYYIIGKLKDSNNNEAR